LQTTTFLLISIAISALIFFCVIGGQDLFSGNNGIAFAFNNYSLLEIRQPVDAAVDYDKSSNAMKTVSFSSNNTSPLLSSYSPFPSADDDQQPCVFYDNLSRTINICGGVASLNTVNKILKNPSLLNNTSGKYWFLNANISVLDGATFVINSSDTIWLKINSTSKDAAYSIKSRGNLLIDNTKISSWNSTINRETDPSPKMPRSYIVALSGATGQMNITNSSLTHLGFFGTKDTWGVSFYSGVESVIRNNTLSSNYRSLYFGENVSNISVSNNTITKNVQSGLTLYKASNIQIMGNEIHNNGLQGIACLQQCKSIVIKDNEIYNNSRDGVRLDKKTINSSIVSNLLYYNKQFGIAVWNSSDNVISENTVKNHKIGISVGRNSHDNIINRNSIVNSSLNGVSLQTNSSANKIEKNVIQYSQTGGISVRDAKNNIFFKNDLTSNINFGIMFVNASNNVLINNKVLDNVPYNHYFKSNSTYNAFRNTLFDNNTLRFYDNTSNAIIENVDNKVTTNNKRIPTVAYATNTSLLLHPTTKNIIIDSVDMFVFPSKDYVNISSINKDFKTNTNNKKWVEISAGPEIESKYVIGDFLPNTQIAININGSFWNAYTSNDSGHIMFLYDKGSRQGNLMTRFEAYPSNEAAISTFVLFGGMVAASGGFIVARRFLRTKSRRGS
jgi:parallel beta-helix repeat protein